MNRYWPPILAALLIVNIGVTTASLLRPVPTSAAVAADIDWRLEAIEDSLLDLEIKVDDVKSDTGVTWSTVYDLNETVDRIESYAEDLYRACEDC